MKAVALLGKTLLVLVALLILAAAAGYAWLQFGDWQARTVRDLEFVHATILEHHPGPVDPENPGFVTLMDEAYARALPLAETARTASDHRAALDAYMDTFNDGHLTVATIMDGFDALSSRAENTTRMAATSGVGIADNEAWITITSFNERNAPIASLTQEIEAQASELRSLDRVVFDLRGNGGGDSSFGTRIVRALWSEEVYRDWIPVSAGAVDWRATADNAAHVHAIAQRHSDNGRPENARYWSDLADRIDSAVRAGDNYVRQNFRTREVTRTVESPVTADVIVITDGACASSCLNFMDELLALPGVRHVGEETSSDTQYIDVRWVDLPSGIGRLWVPLKVYRDRLRPSGGTYVPQISVDAATLDPANLDVLLEAE